MIKDELFGREVDEKGNRNMFAKLVDLLGKENTGSTISSSLDFIEIGEKGLPAISVVSVMGKFNINIHEMANFLGVESDSLLFWIKKNIQLDQPRSVKLLELSSLFFYGEEVFHTVENFLIWIKRPNRAFGGMRPVKLMEMPEGLSKIRDLLGRIEHGVYS